jgi:molecular chaperone GrpE
MTTSAAAVDPSATLAEEVAQLRDLFARRLFEDKAKNLLYEELHAQLALTRGALAEQLLAPLFRELLMVVDRVKALNTNDDVGLESITGELLELLERRDVRRVPAKDRFDPAIHEAVGAVASESSQAGTIIEVVRPGYLLGANLLRPERVVVTGPATDSQQVAKPKRGDIE